MKQEENIAYTDFRGDTHAKDQAEIIKISFDTIADSQIKKYCEHKDVTSVSLSNYYFCNNCKKTFTEREITDFKENRETETYLKNFYTGL